LQLLRWRQIAGDEEFRRRYAREQEKRSWPCFWKKNQIAPYLLFSCALSPDLFASCDPSTAAG
jgi:hypothetical protein